MNIIFNTVKTIEGKFVGQVLSRNVNGNVKILFETPEYVTRQMAVADAKCWKEFHMSKPVIREDKFDVCEDDIVYYRNKKMTGREFADFLTRIIDGAIAIDSEIKYSVRPFENGQGFKLWVTVGRTPKREFRVIKVGQS
jgi:hypothetical protein